MSSINNPHDKFFKELMGRRESALDFIENYFPSGIVERFDLESLEIMKDSFVDEHLKVLDKVMQTEGGIKMPNLAQQWIEEGRVEGELNATKSNLFEILLVRFNMLPEQIRNRINELSNITKLRELLRMALSASSIEEFSQSL